MCMCVCRGHGWRWKGVGQRGGGPVIHPNNMVVVLSHVKVETGR